MCLLVYCSIFKTVQGFGSSTGFLELPAFGELELQPSKQFGEGADFNIML